MNRFLKIINSPIIIWLLSAIFLTIGGTYFTTVRQCHLDASALVSAYKMYRYEDLYRRNAVAEAVTKANTIAELRTALRDQPSAISELKGKSTLEVETAYRAAYLRINRSKLDLSAEAQVSALPSDPRLANVLFGNVSDTLTDADLPALKILAAKISNAYVAMFIHELGTIYQSNCDLPTLWHIAVGERPVLAKAVEVGFLEREKHDLKQ